MVTTVRGTFGEFTGTLVLDGDGQARAEVLVDTASICTGQDQRDAHLRSPDFLDVDSYPDMLFHATGLVDLGGGRYTLAGELTICAVTRPLTIDATLHAVARDQLGEVRAGLEGHAVIRRSDFGLTYNVAMELGGVLISDEVTLELDVSAIRVGSS